MKRKVQLCQYDVINLVYLSLVGCLLTMGLLGLHPASIVLRQGQVPQVMRSRIDGAPYWRVRLDEGADGMDP